MKNKIKFSKAKIYLLVAIIIVLSGLVMLQCSGNKAAGVEPVASDVGISAGGDVGEKLTGTYTFHDDNEEDKEANSIYKWYISDEKNGTYKEISGARKKTYEPTEDMIGKYIKFEVTPVSDTEPTTGLPVKSAPMMVTNGYKIVWVRNQKELDEGIEKYKGTKRVLFKLSPGTYKIDEALKDINDHWIDGSGEGETIMKGNLKYNESEKVRIGELTFEHIENAGEQYCLAFDGCDEVSLEELEINDAVEHGVRATESEVNVKDSTFSNNGASNVYYEKGSKGVVSNITSNDAKTLDGISISASDVTIKNSTFNSNKQTGIFYYRGSKGKVVNCKAIGNKTQHGIEIRESEVDIEGGTYSENNQTGIKYLKSTGKISGVVAENNVKFQGIQIEDSKVDIESSKTNKNGQSGIYVFENSTVNISKPESKENKINGIKVEASEVNVEGAAPRSSDGPRGGSGSGILNNVDSGLTYRAKSSGKISNITSVGSANLYGIEIRKSKVIIESSTFSANKSGGARIYDYSTTNISESNFNKNNSDGLLVEDSQADIKNTTSENNKGFGLLANKSTVSLSNVSLEGNSSGDIGNIDNSSSITKD